MKALVIFAATGIVFAASWAWHRADAEPAPLAAARPVPAPPSLPVTRATAAIPAAAAVPPPAAATASTQLELPDGTFVPTLNGATDAAPLARYWGPYPWSPIVGTERSSAGIDWYRHQDGSYSTTQMVWRQDLGREAALTRVAHPGPTPAAVANR